MQAGERLIIASQIKLKGAWQFVPADSSFKQRQETLPCNDARTPLDRYHHHQRNNPSLKPCDAAVSDFWKPNNLVTGGSSGSGLSVPFGGRPGKLGRSVLQIDYSRVQVQIQTDRRDLSTIDVSGSWLTAATLLLFSFLFVHCPFH